LVDSNLSVGTSQIGIDGGVAENVAVGQSFTGIATNVTRADFWIRRNGSPGGTVRAQVYSHSGDFGTSSVPDSLLGSSDTISVGEISTDFGWVTFTFSTTVNISAQSYVIVFDGSGITGGDASNDFRMRVDTANPHAGNRSNKPNGAWVANATHDHGFRVYGGPASAEMFVVSEVAPEPEVVPEPEIVSGFELVPEVIPEPEVVSESPEPEPEVLPEAVYEEPELPEIEILPETEILPEPEVLPEPEILPELEIVPEQLPKPDEVLPELPPEIPSKPESLLTRLKRSLFAPFSYIVKKWRGWWSS
jgi:hypothetical protein